jgi:acetoacetyl-CoA synthetase
MTTPDLLWSPDPDHVAETRITQFRSWLRDTRDLDFPDYPALWAWSTTDLPGFWAAVAEFLGVIFHSPASTVLGSSGMPGASWFPGATLNYAEQALTGQPSSDLAVVFHREDGRSESLTYGDLRAQVAAARAALVSLGVRKGDRVVALAPNCPETLVAFLAAASLGATWSSCSPDFGPRAIADRFTQIEPTVFIAVDGYVYGGRSFDVRPTVDALRESMPSLKATVLIDYVGGTLPRTLSWSSLLESNAGAELEFDAVPFDHPLWVLYSSGTTGLPKGIVQGHGGIVLEHLKMLALHSDLGPGERFFWFTTTGWMMWNFLISGLMVGCTVVLYDGNPAYPDLDALWKLAADEKVTYFGTSAPFIQSCLKKEVTPAASFDLSALRTLGSTGAPLTPEGFKWIADEVGGLQIASVSGGTDLCTAFIGAAPDVPVWMGELSCRCLGAAVAAYDQDGEEVIEEVGELVVTKPMPSMPVSFWNDPTGDRLKAAYFEDFPGVWRHGDWIRITSRGSAVIYGRSDSTLNRGGVRMGTSEFYRVLEGFPEVADSLVIDTTSVGEPEGELLCFLVLAPGVSLASIEPRLKAELRSELSPRHVPNRFIEVTEIPRTLSGKKCEVPIKKILAGVAPDQAVSRDALVNPAALDPFVRLADR